ncbi:4293_t:CDS:2, partial [Funneliformis geosporum]
IQTSNNLLSFSNLYNQRILSIKNQNLINKPTFIYEQQKRWHIHHHHGPHHGHDGDNHGLIVVLSDPKSRGTKVTLLGLACNVALTAAKGAAGCPPDATHPYGYGKYETIGSLAVSSLLIIGAVGIGHHSYEILINLLPSEIPNSINELGEAINSRTDDNHHLNPNAAWFAVASVIIKEALYRITLKIGLEERSNVLVANAWHHRSDAASSVVALGAIMGSYLGFPFLDPLGGILVAGMIMKSGFEIMLDSLKELVDVRVEQEVINQVEKAVEKLKGTDPNIVNFHNIRGRKSGPFYLIDMILQVNPDLTISKAHNIEEQVRQAVKKECKCVKEVLMHLDVEDQSPHH